MQIRTQVTLKVKKPNRPKRPKKPSATPKTNPAPKKIDWRQVDLSTIELPAPKRPEPKLRYENGKTYFKNPQSFAPSTSVILTVRRKYLLHTEYTNLILRYPLLLFFNVATVSYNTLLNLRIALAAHGAQMKVIRSGLFIHALRVAQYVETARVLPQDMWDPSGLAMHAKILERKRTVEEFEMKALLRGSQICVVYFDAHNWRPESIDTAKVGQVIRILERTGRTPVVGARFLRTVATAEDVKKMKTLENINKVRGQLIGLLGGTAQALAGTLSTPAGGLALTLAGRQKAMEEEQGSNAP
jgi:ribosomal protein L10